MSSREKATKIVEDIKDANLEDGEVAYVKADGTWERGLDGCQPAYTQAVGPDDFEASCDDDIIDAVEDHLVYHQDN